MAAAVGFLKCILVTIFMLFVVPSTWANLQNRSIVEDDLCLKKSVCSAVTRELLKHQSFVDKSVCHYLYKCDRKENEDNEILKVMDLILQTDNRVKRSTRGLIFGRPFRKPKDSEKRYECRKCEHKRGLCTKYYIFTYGVCGGAWLIGGTIASTGCNVITLPRTVDCALNTYYNCFLQNCGLVGI